MEGGGNWNEQKDTFCIISITVEIKTMTPDDQHVDQMYVYLWRSQSLSRNI